VAGELLGQAEIGDPGQALIQRQVRPAGQQHVGRIQIAVDDAMIMSVLYG
jgi:hypothetical protein